MSMTFSKIPDIAFLPPCPVCEAENVARLRRWRLRRRQPLLVDVFAPEEIRIWMRLVSDGRGDLEPEECGDEVVGERPEWLDCELEQMGWDDILSTDYCWGEKHPGPGWTFSTHKTQWAMERGIAPYQPFLLAFEKPSYSTSYEGECDVEYGWEVVCVLPWKTESIVRVWERLLENNNRDDAFLVKKRDDDRRRQVTETDKLFVRRGQLCFARGQRSYDDMEMPSGVRMFLETALDGYVLSGSREPNPGWGVPLTSGEDDNGDWKMAEENLFENATKVGIPGFSREMFDKLPRFSRW